MQKLPWWEVAARMSELVDLAADLDQGTIIEKDGEDKAILMSMKRKLASDATIDILSSPSRNALLTEAQTTVVDYDATDLWREMYGTEPPWLADVAALSEAPAAPVEPPPPPPKSLLLDLIDAAVSPPSVSQEQLAVEELSRDLERVTYKAQTGRAEGLVRGPVAPARNPSAPWVFETTDVPLGWQRDADHLPAPIWHDLHSLTRDYLHCRTLWTELDSASQPIPSSYFYGRAGRRRRQQDVQITPQTLITFCSALYHRGETLEGRLRKTSNPEQSLRVIEMMIDLTYIWYTVLRRNPLSPRTSVLGVEKLHDRCVTSLRQVMRRYRLTNHAPEHLLVTRTSPSPVAPARQRQHQQAVPAAEPAVAWQRDSHG